MPFWPFKRRRSALRDDAVSEKARALPEPAGDPKSAPPAPTPPVPRRSSKRGQRKRRASQQPEKATDAQFIESKKRQSRPSSVGPDKENIPPLPRKGSIEDITALPVTQTLQSSPHLRPADVERPPIPYNFRPHSASQTSIQRQEAAGRPSRPSTLKSKRSTYDSGTPQRRRSSRKPHEDKIREEEIRAMSAPIPIPKRPGEGPLRRDSKKIRSMGKKDSNVSLPVEESIHSSMSGIMEQRGWEVGSLAVFNPRPAVRLSGTPQYVAPGSVPSTSYMSRDGLKRDKEKAPLTKDMARRRECIGERADQFDASDLRMLMERDAKRQAQRRREQQEKLDKKLRNRVGRERGDSDRKKRREAEEAKLRAEEERQIQEERQAQEERTALEERRAQEQRRARELVMPPTDVHPAFRDRQMEEDPEAVGLGIGAGAATAIDIDSEHHHEHALPTTTEQGTENTGTYLNYPPQGDIPENPFEDSQMLPESPPMQTETLEDDRLGPMPGAFTATEVPMEDTVGSTAQAARVVAQTATPPQSPSRAGSLPIQPQQVDKDLPLPPPIASDRRTSEPKMERRAGGWASIFRRGGTNLRRQQEDGRDTPSDFSFSNTSRESMRNQPLPAHLVDTMASQRHSKSGTPVRTFSKFREDLPEMPISPPDSRTQSPDVTLAAAAAAAARRARSSPQPVDIPGAADKARDSDPDQISAIVRNDTPISPARGHGLMSASLASVDSEGSWLASGSTKRQSGQSVLSRGMGSLSRRKPEFTGSYEELGGDKDAEYFRRLTPSPGLRNSRISSPARAGASPDEESEYGEVAQIAESTSDPLTVHQSVRRKPTLVHRDPRVKSREGLLAEYAGAEGEEASPEKPEFDLDEEYARVHSATSVNYKGHARQISAGSARILDIPAGKRASVDAGRPTSMSPQSPTM